MTPTLAVSSKSVAVITEIAMGTSAADSDLFLAVTIISSTVSTAA